MPPVNDNFASAATLPIDGTVVNGSNIGATIEGFTENTTQRSRSGNVATLTIPGHQFAFGSTIQVSGFTGGAATYNTAAATITGVPDGDHISYANVGINEGATADTNGRVRGNEPPNHGKTVWYKFTLGSTPPAAGINQATMCVGTRRYAGSGIPVRTVLQVFVAIPTYPVNVANLSEVNYLVAWKQGYGGWDLGSEVVLTAQYDGTVYYVRVDGVAGQEGPFQIYCKPFHNVEYGGCGKCEPQFGQGYTCEGFATVPFGYETEGPLDPAGSGHGGSGAATYPMLSFGASSYPPGHYLVKFCSAAGGSFFDTWCVATGIFTTGYWITRAAFETVPHWVVYYNGSDQTNPKVPGIKTTAQRSRSSGIATLKVPGHGLSSGWTVIITGLGGSGYNVGQYDEGGMGPPGLGIPGVEIVVLDPDHFIYTNAGTDEAVTTDGGGTSTPQDTISMSYDAAIQNVYGSLFGTLDEAVFASRCDHAHFDHAGGDIQLALYGQSDVTNSQNKGSMVWALYRLDPIIELDGTIAICLTIESGGPSASASINWPISNLNTIQWSCVVVTMAATGGITSPQKIPIFPLFALTTRTPTLSCVVGSSSVTATLVLSCGLWGSNITFTRVFSAILIFNGISSPTLDLAPVGLCGGGKHIYDISWFLENLGLVQFFNGILNMTVAATNGVLVGAIDTCFTVGPHGVTPATCCPTAASYNPHSPDIPCNGNFTFAHALVAPASAIAPVSTTLTLTILDIDNVTVLFTKSVNVTVPL